MNYDRAVEAVIDALFEHTDLDDLGRLARIAVEAAAPYLLEGLSDWDEERQRAERAEAEVGRLRNHLQSAVDSKFIDKRHYDSERDLSDELAEALRRGTGKWEALACYEEARRS